MQAENVEEYRILREEMRGLKDCLTTYVGWVFGGAGAGFLAIGYAARDLKGHNIAMGFSALAVAFVLSLVFLIIVYKFISHNRYAGYCRLLTQERFRVSDALKGKALIAWEACVGRQRIFDFRNRALAEYAEKARIKGFTKARLEAVVKRFTGPEPEEDKDNVRNGFRIVLRALTGHVTGTSWPFPVYVASLFFVFVWLYVGLALYILGSAGRPGPTAHQWVILSAGVLVLGYLWATFFGKVHNLMEGSRSVRAFALKLLLVRRWYLEERKGVSNYEIVFCFEEEEVRAGGPGPDQ